MTNTSSTPIPRAMTRQESNLIWLLLAAAFVAILNETTMSVAMPKLMDEFHLEAATAQWLSTIFMLVMAIVIPTTGFLLQRFTTRVVFLTAASLFVAGTALATFSFTFEMLLVARAIQAGGTAIMMPLLMTTVMTLVPPAERGRFMGRISIVMSLAPAIGPSMAGAVIQSLSWHWVFGIVLPIAIIALLAGAKWMVNSGEQTHQPLDILSVVLAAFAFGGIVYGLSQINSGHTAPSGKSSLSTAMLVSLAVGIVALGFFVWRQLVLQRKDDALMDLRVFRSSIFTMSILQFVVLSAAFFGAITVLPLYLQKALLLEPVEAGLVMLPGALAMGLLGPVIGRMYDKYGTRVLLVPGSILSSIALWYYTTVGVETQVWTIVVAQIVLSVGLALSFTPLFTASLGALTPNLYSHGSAVVSTVQQVAGAAGIAVLMSVVTSVSTAAVSAGASAPVAEADGTRAAFIIAAVLSLATIVLAFFIKKPADNPEMPQHAGH